MNRKFAFIDESGDNGLNFSKSGTHFLVTAVIVNESDYDAVEKGTLKLRSHYFRGGELKSSKIGKNAKKRKDILKDISGLKVRVFTVAIDKRHLVSKGFKYKKSFYKYIHRILDSELIKVFEELTISSDSYGDAEFMEGFQAYIKKHHPPDLFNNFNFKFEGSKSNTFLQLADFICGSIGRVYNSNDDDSDKSQYIEILKPVLILIYHWPPRYEKYINDLKDSGHIFNEIITDVSCRIALNYISAWSSTTDQVKKYQVECLKYLLFNFYINPDKYISTKELIRHLSPLESDTIKPTTFRLQVMAKLRDQGVLVASNERGFKIPTTEKDCLNFIETSNKTIAPMLTRIQRFRNSILLATNGQFDVLGPSQFSYLKKVFDDI